MGETDCGGEAMLSKSLIQLSVNGWSCVPSLLFQFSSVTQSCPLRPHRLQQATTPCPSSIPSLLKLMSIKSVRPSNHLILSCPLLLPPAIFPSIRFFSSFPLSQSLSSGSFHKPLILLHRRADRLKTTITEN